jgi:hypothetical protein
MLRGTLNAIKKTLCVSRLPEERICNILGTANGISLEFSEIVEKNVNIHQETLVIINKLESDILICNSET